MNEMNLELTTGIQLIGLAGAKGSGKDTLGAHLADHINTKGQRHAVCMGLADLVKDSCTKIYGIDREICDANNHTKNTTYTEVRWDTMPPEIYEQYHTDSDFMTYRELLQIYGTELVRNKLGNNYWLDAFTERVNTIDSPKPLTVIITDVRFDNEAQYTMNNRGHVIRILSQQNQADKHPSELGVTRFNYEVEGYGLTTLEESQEDICTLYSYIELHERVRNAIK